MANITTVQDFKDSIHLSASLGYPVFYMCADGGVLSWDAVVAMQSRIIEAISDRITDRYDVHADAQWDVIAWDINYEDVALYCDHTYIRIDPAYEPDVIEDDAD